MTNIGVDIDEVLAETVKGFLKFYNNKATTNFSFDEVYDYSFGKQFGLTPEQEIANIKEFFASDNFRNIEPIENSVNAITYLAKSNRMYAVTSRPEALTDATKLWLDQYYPNCFEDVILTNSHFDKTKTKSKVCVDKEIDIFIEDQIIYAEDCADVCSKVFLINKPWNRGSLNKSNIIRVDTWAEILQTI